MENDIAKIRELKERGMLLMRSNRLDEAKALFQQLCTNHPHDADAWYVLSAVNGMLHNMDEAGDCCRRVIAINPNHGEAHTNLGNVLSHQGRHDEAISHYHQALHINPGNAVTHNNLANAFLRSGRMDEAIDSYRRALAIRPDYAVACYNLGKALQEQGHLEEAVACFRQVIAAHPNNAEAHNTLGLALSEQGNLEEAKAIIEHALKLQPEFAEAVLNLGSIEYSQGHIEPAIEKFRKAIRLKPGYAEAHVFLGNALKDRNELEDAAECYRRAIELKPDSSAAYSNLGIILRIEGKLEAAEQMVEKACKLQPDLVAAHVSLGNIHILQGKTDAAVACFQEALRLDPNNAGAHGNLLMAMNYRSEYSADELFKAAKDWGIRHSPQQPCLPPPHNLPDPQRRLRIGYVSEDFRNHPIGYFIEQVLEHHNKAHFEIFCYYNNATHDDMTKRLQNLSNQWRDVAAMSDQALARQIRQDDIDILVDLSGHTGKNRLLSFAHRPAPIQATWMGYIATTGLPAMDYIIGDRYVIPPEEERYYTEQAIRLPKNYLCFTPPHFSIEVSPLPALSRGMVTFGCFNNAAKLTPEVIGCWAELLRELPDSQLYLKNLSFGDEGVRHYFLELFDTNGITAERIRFSGRSPRKELLTSYQDIDIGLDPFPYTGGTTTAEALWMGIPVITLRGHGFVGRVGDSILSNAGLGELVVDSKEAYIAKAIDMAADLPHLAEFRERLRRQFLNSPLCNGSDFTQELENVYRKMWNDWCSVRTTPLG